MDKLWNEVLNEIELEISRPIFLGFFKRTKLTALEDSVAVSDTPTQAVSSYIEQRYYSLVKKVLDKKTGENTSLTFTSEGGGEGAKKAPAAGPLFAPEVSNTIQKPRPQRVRPDFTFESLAVSGSNQLAYTAAQTVASDLGRKYNPLFLYGTVGVGKTHLMNAIANKAFDDNPDTNVVYLTTEEFTNEVIEAMQNKSMANIRKKFRNVDLLILDDIQFLAGKDRVQEELFHTFNALIDRGCQIAFSSDRPPSEIKIEARLASRFEGGLTIDIQPPDPELRTAILLIKSRRLGLNFSPDAAMHAAEKIKDARALEGFLLKVASVRIGENGQEISIDDVSPLLGAENKESSILHPDTIIKSICDYFNIKTTQIRGTKRDAYLVRPRHICMFLLKEEAGLTYVEIGNLLGGRDHTTVMHAVDKIKDLASKSDKTREDIMFIKRRIKEV